MRCIGIDYGERRIGLSYGDEIGVATPLPAAREATEPERLARVASTARERRATDLVVGYPYNMDGTVGFKALEVDAFLKKLAAIVDLPIHRIDERLTTQVAALAFSKKRDDELRRSGKIDSVAATLILQDFLSQRIPLPEYDPLEDEEDDS